MVKMGLRIVSASDQRADYQGEPIKGDNGKCYVCVSFGRGYFFSIFAGSGCCNDEPHQRHPDTCSCKNQLLVIL